VNPDRSREAQLDAIVRFVRAVQQANGIVYSEHRM